MTTICQNVATLTTTTLRTTSTVYIDTSIQQIAGRPTTSTIVVPSATCRTAGSGNSTTVNCATSSVTRLTVVTPAASQVQVILTVTNQIVQTQLNTLFGTLCNTLPGRPPSQPSPQPAPPGVTDTTYTTEYFTVTGPAPSTTPTQSPTSTKGSTRTALSRNTVFGTGDPTSESSPSDTALGAGSSQSGSSKVPIGAIVGGVLGGLVAAALLGLLVYYLLFKKSISAKGYKAPGEASPYHDNDQSDVFSSQGTGYGGQGYPSGQQSQVPAAQQFQSGPTQFQGSYPMQYNDMGGQGAQHLQPQNLNMYSDAQGHQYQAEMGQVPFNATSGATSGFPAAAAAGAALPVVAAASLGSHRFSSSSSPPPGSMTTGHYSPDSHLSTPLIHHGSPHQHPNSHTATPVPYRGYAEPADG